MIKIKLTEVEKDKLTKAATDEQEAKNAFVSAHEKYLSAVAHRADLFDMVLASHNVDKSTIVEGSTTNLIDGELHIPASIKLPEPKFPKRNKNKK